MDTAWDWKLFITFIMLFVLKAAGPLAGVSWFVVFLPMLAPVLVPIAVAILLFGILMVAELVHAVSRIFTR